MEKDLQPFRGMQMIVLMERSEVKRDEGKVEKILDSTHVVLIMRYLRVMYVMVAREFRLLLIAGGRNGSLA